MYLPYFVQEFEAKKKVVGILAHVWSKSPNYHKIMPSQPICDDLGATNALGHGKGHLRSHDISNRRLFC